MQIFVITLTSIRMSGDKKHQMGNCINGVSLAVKTFSTQINEGGQREIELCLSFGATGWESVERLAKEAISTGITPMINTLNVIGLISIPRMVSTYHLWIISYLVA